MAEELPAPRHIGFIPDGNRRWAKQHGLPTYEGHMAGHNATKDVLLECLRRGVQYATLYAFSTENWRRDKDEVSRLMKLFFKATKDDLKFFIENGVKLIVIGSRDELDSKLVEAIAGVEAATADLQEGTCVICLNYGGQQEIVDAAKAIANSGVKADDITAELVEQNLYAPEIPPIDLVVRTSGEQRLSNFMLWRAAYSEFIFLKDKHWPDMTKADVTAILDEYARRGRRFGG